MGVKLEIRLLTTIPLKVGVKWGVIGAFYTQLEKIFKGYKIFSFHFQTRLDLKKIWMSKVLGQ